MTSTATLPATSLKLQVARESRRPHSITAVAPSAALSSRISFLNHHHHHHTPESATMHILLETRIKHDFPGAAHQAIGNGWEPFLRWFYTTFAAASTTVLPRRPSRFPVVRVIHGRLSTHSTLAAAGTPMSMSAAHVRMGAESSLVCGKCGDEGARPRIRRRGFDAMDTVVVPYCQECMDGELADGSRVQWAELELEETDGEGEEGYFGLFA